MASFYVIQGNDQGRCFEILEMTTTIGRDQSNHIQLHDAEVSRRHASVVYSENSFRLIDNNSANGVYVNEMQIKDCILNNGDYLLLGQTSLLFAKNPSADSSDFTVLPSKQRENNGGHQSETAFTHHNSSYSNSNSFFGQFPSLAEMKKNPQAAAHLRTLYRTALVTSQTLEIGTLLCRMLDIIAERIEMDRGCIQIFDPDTLQLIPKAVYPLSTQFTISPAIIERVAKQREAVLECETQEENGQEVLRDIICVPMAGRYGLVGIIYIDRIHPSSLPSEKTPTSGVVKLTADRSLMVAIAHQAALAVEDTRYYKGMIQAERLAVVGQTVSTLSHHIKNILQGISGGSYLIKMGLNTHNEDLIRQGWGIVEKNQDRISKLIHDMLTFSKERKPVYEFGNIVETVADIVELMQPHAQEEKVEIQFKTESAIPDFFFDAEQINHAVTNIVANGIDAAKLSTEQKTNAAEADYETKTAIIPVVSNTETLKFGLVQVQINFNPKREIISIIVDDNGPGIPKTERKYLFRAFYSQNKGSGTGLGLSVAHKIVQEHGGAIHIDNSPLGGARFEIELPLKLGSPNDLKANQ